MPLPEENRIWPPAHLQPVFAMMREHLAWYTGDVGELAAIYGGSAASATHQHEGRAMRGGVMGAFSRFWWGRPIVAGELRTALHIPMAANLATLSSDTVNAEPPTFRLAGDTDGAVSATEDRLNLIMNAADTHVTFNEAGELEAVLGGTYWVLDWDTDGPHDHVFLRSVDADSAVPVFAGGQLREVTFWTRFDDEDGTTWRHVEHHEPGAIIHALYVSKEATKIGHRVPLAARTETEHLAAVAGAIHEELQTVIPTGTMRLTVEYEPNVRKSRRLRKLPNIADWGRSDFEGIEGMLNSLDETWSSWMRDLKLGRGRVFVPEAMLQSGGRGGGAFFDAEREIYSTLSALPNKDGRNLEATQFAIRVDEHERTAYGLKKEILQATGWSLSSYGEHGDHEVTATEVSDRRSDSERTRDKKKRYATKARTRAAVTALEIDGLVFRGRGGRPGVEVVADWPEVSQQDPEKVARTIQLLDAATAISVATKVARANPDWDDDRIDVETAAILREKGIEVPDPAEFRG